MVDAQLISILVVFYEAIALLIVEKRLVYPLAIASILTVIFS